MCYYGSYRLHEEIVYASRLIGVEPGAVQPVSIDLHARLDHPVHLYPGDFDLIAVNEIFNLPSHIGAIILGVSTVARQGISVEAAGLVDPGFYGRPTLEVHNMKPSALTTWPNGVEEETNKITIRNGDRIAQVMFFDVKGPAIPYDGRYQGDMEASGPK